MRYFGGTLLALAAAAAISCGPLAAGCRHRDKVYIMRHANSDKFVLVYEVKDGKYADVNGNKKLDAFCNQARCELLDPMEDPAAAKYLGEGAIVQRDSPRGRELQNKFEKEVLPGEEELKFLLTEAKKRPLTTY